MWSVPNCFSAGYLPFVAACRRLMRFLDSAIDSVVGRIWILPRYFCTNSNPTALSGELSKIQTLIDISTNDGYEHCTLPIVRPTSAPNIAPLKLLNLIRRIIRKSATPPRMAQAVYNSSCSCMMFPQTLNYKIKIIGDRP
jgi:hypothetical protein